MPDLQSTAASAAQANGIPADWFTSLIGNGEGGFRNPNAVSPKGARGPGQLMPTTAAEVLKPGEHIDNPADNLNGAARYAAQLYNRYGGDITKATAAYNAGPGAVDHHGGVPPYKETQAYVARVTDGLAPPPDDELQRAYQNRSEPPANLPYHPTHEDPTIGTAPQVPVGTETLPPVSDDELQKAFAASKGGGAPSPPASSGATLSAPMVDTGPIGAVDAFVRHAANAVTGGWADKIQAGVNALGQTADASGRNDPAAFGHAYSTELTRQRALDSQSGAFSPEASAAGGATGVLAQGFLLPETKAAGLGGRLLQGAGQGSALGLVNSTGQARGSVKQVALSAVVPTAVGALGGAGLNAAFGPGMQRAATNALGSYAQVGMEPSLAINGGEGARRIAQALKGVPLVGSPLTNLATRDLSAIDSGVLQTAAGYGQSTNALQAGSALQTGAASARDALKSDVNSAYAPLNNLETSAVMVPARNTAQAIADLKARYPNTPEWFRLNAPTIARLDETLANNNGQLTYGELKNIRTDLGALASGGMGNNVNTIDQAALNRVYGAMSQDMEGGVHQTAFQEALSAGKSPLDAGAAGNTARTQLATANAANQRMRDTIDTTLLPIMDAKSPEAAFTRMVASAQWGSSRADLDGLLRAKAALPADAWNEAAAGAISTMGRDAGGNFSAAKFSTELGKLSPDGRKALFGSAALAKDLDAFEQIARDQVKASRFYNASNSGNVLATLSGGGAIAKSLTDAAHGNFAPAIATALSAAGGYTAARLLASPGFARLMLKASTSRPGLIDDMFARFAAANPSRAAEINTFRNKLSGTLTAGALSPETSPAPATTAPRGILEPSPAQ